MIFECSLLDLLPDLHHDIACTTHSQAANYVKTLTVESVSPLFARRKKSLTQLRERLCRLLNTNV